MNIFLFWILVGLWGFNILASLYAGKVRVVWIDMQRWLLEQAKTLMESPDFKHEAYQATEIGQEINQWVDQSLKFGGFIIISAQISIVAAALTVMLLGNVYIPTAVALIEATAIVYAWIMYQRYQKSKGMCYAVQVNVNAAEIFREEHTESDNVGSESNSTDKRRDTGNSEFRRRKDD